MGRYIQIGLVAGVVLAGVAGCKSADRGQPWGSTWSMKSNRTLDSGAPVYPSAGGLTGANQAPSAAGYQPASGTGMTSASGTGLTSASGTR